METLSRTDFPAGACHDFFNDESLSELDQAMRERPQAHNEDDEAHDIASSERRREDLETRLKQSALNQQEQQRLQRDQRLQHEQQLALLVIQKQRECELRAMHAAAANAVSDHTGAWASMAPAECKSSSPKLEGGIAQPLRRAAPRGAHRGARPRRAQHDASRTGCLHSNSPWVLHVGEPGPSLPVRPNPHGSQAETRRDIPIAQADVQMLRYDSEHPNAPSFGRYVDHRGVLHSRCQNSRDVHTDPHDEHLGAPSHHHSTGLLDDWTRERHAACNNTSGPRGSSYGLAPGASNVKKRKIAQAVENNGVDVDGHGRPAAISAREASNGRAACQDLPPGNGSSSSPKLRRQSSGAGSTSAMLEDLVGQFSDNVIRRHALIMNHLQAVQNVLSSPDPVALACATVEHLAAMQDGRNAASSSDDQRQRRAMRKLLAHIGPHPRQMQQFHQQSEIFRRIYAVRSASQEAIEDIRRQVCRQNELTGDAMSILRSILTPVQMARFFVWAERDVESAQDLVNGPVLSSNPPSDNPTTTDSSAQPSDHSFPDDGSGY